MSTEESSVRVRRSLAGPEEDEWTESGDRGSSRRSSTGPGTAVSNAFARAQLQQAKKQKLGRYQRTQRWERREIQVKNLVLPKWVLVPEQEQPPRDIVLPELQIKLRLLPAEMRLAISEQISKQDPKDVVVPEMLLNSSQGEELGIGRDAEQVRELRGNVIREMEVESDDERREADDDSGSEQRESPEETSQNVEGNEL